MTVLPTAQARFDGEIPLLIIGAGACGLIAALTARETGLDVLVLERDAVPAGSTALSSGMVPACGTRLQAEKNVEDSANVLLNDIQRKAKGLADPVIAEAVSRATGPTIDWLAADHDIPFTLVEGFLYPGHSALRMHAPPSRTGAELIGALTRAAERAGIDILTEATVTALFGDPDGRVRGVRIARPDGNHEDIGCGVLILACNGYGGAKEMLRTHIPEIADALYFGHVGNQGDAVHWGEALGGEAADMSGYQGHGSVATPHGILITWALMMEGGLQVNADGNRFSNEHHGYSEQCTSVLAQPESIAWDVYDTRLHDLGMGFEDYRDALDQGAVRRASDIAELAGIIDCPTEALGAAIADSARDDVDEFSRDWSKTPALEPPFFAIKVTGALFHTQGGLRVDARARVLRRESDAPLPNLLAGGGAARGVSGPDVSGYLSGNGLLTAVGLGRIAGEEAIEILRAER